MFGFLKPKRRKTSTAVKMFKAAKLGAKAGAKLAGSGQKRESKER